MKMGSKVIISAVCILCLILMKRKAYGRSAPEGCVETPLCVHRAHREAVGKLRNCGMRKVKCGIENAE